MKKCVRILFFTVLLLISFTSCSRDAGNNPPETETNAPETSPVVLELTAAEEEEITALFNRMIEYEGYCLEPMMLRCDTSRIDRYHKVINERFDTWEEWMAFVESIYTGDELEQVIEAIEREGHFVNIDGYTYVAAYAGTSFLSKDFTFSVEERTSDILTVKLRRINRASPGSDVDYEVLFVYKLRGTDAGWRIFQESVLDRIPLS